MLATEDRIKSLEKQANTLYALVVISLVFFVAAAGIVAFSLFGGSDVVQAKRFEVVDDGGR
ncbi:MAG: hypothetical protein GY894_11010 [Planctomycetes bacterium]|nr:hypothetical protein [Planctomycetota bacterium]